MTKTKKMLLGGVTLWPLFYIGLFMMFIVGHFVLAFSGMMAVGPEGAGTIMGLMFAGFGVIFVLHALTILGSLALLVYYVVHALRNPALEDDSNQRLLWVVILFVGGMIAMPIYWYTYIWQTPHAPASG